MIKLLPLVLVIGYALLVWQVSALRLRRMLDRHATPLAEPGLDPVLARLARALDLPRLTVHVLDVDAVNGLAAPDGRVFITKGLLARFREGAVSAEELASVIAHELGHVAHGHARRRMIDVTGTQALRTAAALAAARFLPGIGPMIAGFLATLLVARLSRQDEFEADAWAAALLIKAGIGTAPQKSLFAKLERLVGAGGAGPEWLRSHPRSQDRIRMIENHEARWGLG
jgi:putative metalloprotease